MDEIKAFQEGLRSVGVEFVVRSNNPEPDTVTLSDGSRVRLVDKKLVSYQKKGKKQGVISYMICSSRRVKK